MLHTQEKILRYELAQKRKLLTQLKEELEYSREKWAQAREKNTNTEEQWRQLRTEFASRKNTLSEDPNNSAESGYSDDKECSSSDDELASDVEDMTIRVRKSHTGKNLNGSTNTLTDSTDKQDTEYTKTVNLQSSKNVQLVESDVQICSEDSVPVVNEVEQTWERVSDIVQKEILRLTDQTQKLDQHHLSLLKMEKKSKQTDITNIQTTSAGTSRTLEGVLAARSERFRRLEEQAQQLKDKVVNTNKKSDEISNKLDNLHETYGNTDDVETVTDIDHANEDVESDSSVHQNDEQS